MDNQLQQDELLLGILLDKVKQFSLGFRGHDALATGSSLRKIPVTILPGLGDGARDAMKVFEEQWRKYPATSPSNPHPE